MPSILVYVERVGGNPTATSLELVAGARALAGQDGTVTALVVGGEPLPAGVLAGADRIVVAKAAGQGGYTSESHGAIVRRWVERSAPDLVLFPNSYVGPDLATPTAALTGRPLLSSCIALELKGEMLAGRCQSYGGKTEAIVECPLPAVAAVNPDVFKLSDQAGEGEVIEDGEPVDLPGRMRVEAVETASGGIDITLSERLVCVGRGIGEEDNIELARELARALDAELVASRPIVDQGWVEKSRQVGKSGKTVKPKLYLAIGVSGAPEHLEGMRDAELIIAVNTDPTAPIFDVAHFGATCDVLDLLPVLTEKMQETAA